MTGIDRRLFLAGLPAAGLAACTTAEQQAILGDILGGTSSGGITSAEAAQGIRAALDQGIGTAVARLGRTNGYFGDPMVRIPLPGRLASIRDDLRPFGLSGALDELETQLNRGAETAAPRARSIFTDAVRSMSISDALGIVRGGPTSATDYFEQRTTPSLTNLFTPIMRSALQQTGAIRTLDNLTARLAAVPLAPNLGEDAKTDLIAHGVERGLGGLFNYIAEEEAEIRRNPAKRTSEILRRVFG